jgi:large subunit ribosomal protein L4
MPTAKVYNMDGEQVDEIELNSYIFAAPINIPVIHQVVTCQLKNRRQGNASTKRRGEVSGGNKKPYRQKGTGRARQGSIRAPQFRGGGTVFGPKPRPYVARVPRKMRRLAIRSVLSDKAANGRIILLDQLTMNRPRTKDMQALLANLPIERDRKVLLMMPRHDVNVWLSARNLENVHVQHVASINVVQMLKYEFLLMPLETLRFIEDVFGHELRRGAVSTPAALTGATASAE